MHMADALISPTVGVAFAVASGVLLVGSSRSLARSEHYARLMPTMGVMGAFVFAAQMINFAIPGTGSSGHLGGGLLLALLLGGPAAFVVMASVLTVQCLLFADGGLLALGCNVFNLAFWPAFVGLPLVVFLRHTPLQRWPWLPVVLGVVASLELGAAGVAVQTSLSGRSDLPLLPFLGIMLGIHLPIALVEGLVTVVVLNALQRQDSSLPAGGAWPGHRLLAVFGVAVFLATVLSWFASTRPDGLEWSVARITGHDEAPAPAATLASGAARLQEHTACFPDYAWPAGREPTAGPESQAWPAVSAGSSAAGGLGAAVVMAVILLLAGSLGLWRRWSRGRSVGTLLLLAPIVLASMEDPRPAAPPICDEDGLRSIVRDIRWRAIADGTVQAAAGEGVDPEIGATMNLTLAAGSRIHEHHRWLIQFEAAQGPGSEAEIQTYSGLNDRAAGADPSCVIKELWLDLQGWKSGDRELRIRLGQIDLTCLFDCNALANDGTRQFLSPAFVNNPTIPMPDPGPGLAVQWLDQSFAVRLAVADGEADYQDLAQHSFTIAEIETSVLPGTTLRVLGWLDGHRREPLQDDGRRCSYGLGASADYQGEIAGFFLRYGWCNPDLNEFSHHLSLGTQVSLAWLGRECDVCGLAYGWSWLGPAGRNLVRTEGYEPGVEGHAEIYYHHNIDAQWSVGGSFQHVLAPAGARDTEEVWALAAQARLEI